MALSGRVDVSDERPLCASNGRSSANRLAPGLRNQSQVHATSVLVTRAYSVQQNTAPLSPRRSGWIGGQGTEP